MGIMSLNFLSKGRSADETVLASPDTEFGPELALASPPGSAGTLAPGHGSAGEAMLRLGHAIRGRAPAADEDDEDSSLRLPLIGHLSLPRQLRILLVAFGAGILLTILAMWQNAAVNARVAAQVQVASDLLMHSQRVGKAAPNALAGNPASFDQLAESRLEVNRDLRLLTQGGNVGSVDVPGASGRQSALLARVRATWTASELGAANILQMKPALIGFDKSVRQLDALASEMLVLTEDLMAQNVERGASARELAAIGRMMMLTQRLARGASSFFAIGVPRDDAAVRIGADSAAFEHALETLLAGGAAQRNDDLRDKLRQVQVRFDAFRKDFAPFLDNPTAYSKARAAARTIHRDNEEMKKQVAALQGGYREQQSSSNVWFWLLVAASIFTLATAGSISRVMLQDSRNRTRGAETRRREAEAMRQLAQAKEEEAKATNDQNQAAILRLMNELQDVANGDLTVHATVSEDITGAIADSVNFTVEELRGLVLRVTGTAEQVTQASNEAQQISTELLGATEQQSREIEEASSTVLRMAGEITDVSKSANESAEVARQSVAAAEQGANAVQDAISGMHEIREQIQETSKRIKRLGESSQEIGEITELISDITEQTNVLALNAAIQAASAGEAGRGFSVVAEEVQRLAERSAEAAKQIGALVRTIQTDTHDAVAAMEKSTQGVVEGARLSDAAGAALADISRVSNRLAELIQGISFAAGLQATSANGVAHNMQHILSVTEHTQAGTRQTAHSIHQLAALAQELKNSVSRFRVAQ
ncbi:MULTISPECIES: methyl-accepting chemotaxis protein [Massilia]|uniref:Methyl-accepting chemotaxis protein n=1 Tax=Massilia haematophila TaxID=457923 RepID=A0ABV7PKD3_9BURK|nr:methyl-accepting chemotaxis protein [Massilia sp.]